MAVQAGRGTQDMLIGLPVAWLSGVGWVGEESGQRLVRGDESRSQESGAEWSNFSERGVS